MKPLLFAVRRTALSALLLALAACSTPPATRYHSLLPAAAVSHAPTPQRVLSLGQVEVPVPADQAQWLVRLADGSLRVLEHERWASALRDELRAALLQGLAAHGGVVEQRNAAQSATWRLQAEVTRFELMPGRGTQLGVSWSLRPARAEASGQASGGTKGITCSGRFDEAVAAEGALPLAQAQVRAVQRWAAQVVQVLQGLEQGATTSCPAS